MQQDNAQPSAVYALPRKRNPWAIECNKTMRGPQQRTHCQDNEMLGLSNATRQCAALSGVHIAKKTKSLVNAKRQCAALSGAHIAKKTKLLGNLQQDNAQPSAAHTLPRKRGQSDATRQCAALSRAHIMKRHFQCA